MKYMFSQCAWHGDLKALRVLLFIGLLLPMMGAGAHLVAPGTGAVAAHPLIIQTAAQTPDAVVSVIVQKGSASSSPEALVSQLGGTVTKDLHIINAFVADLTASAAVQLSRAENVRWVSPNAAVQESDDRFTTWATELVANTTGQISSGFTSAPIRSGSYLWFNSAMRVEGVGRLDTVTVNFDQASALVNIYGEEFTLTIPPATVIFSPTALMATTHYDSVDGKWITTLPSRLGGTEVFLSGMSLRVPYDIPNHAATVTLSGRFSTDTQGVRVAGWQWSAATYSEFNTDMNALGVKPCKDALASEWPNTNNAGTPENYKALVIAGACGDGGTNYTGTYSAAGALVPVRMFNSANKVVDSGTGPNGTYGSAASASQTFAGFTGEQTPGRRIDRVEVAVKAYVTNRLSTHEDPLITIKVDAQTVSNVAVSHSHFSNKVGLANAGTIYVNVTGNRNWTWADIDDSLQLTIDHRNFAANHPVYYDAVGLRITTSWGNDNSGGHGPTSRRNNLVDAAKLESIFPQVVRATDAWLGIAGRPLQGQGVTVAVLDSGVLRTEDLKDRLIASVNFASEEHSSLDAYGHGTFVAGIIAGDGKSSDGRYMGIAPKTNVLNARVSGDNGMSTEADVVAALQWILENKARYGVRVVNISMNSSVLQSYHTSPLCAAVEVLWFNGIVVVASAGNNGTANLYPPANDPFVITVGATDDRGTLTLSDDTLANFSAYGTTEAGTRKPEIVAPGRNIVGLLPENEETVIGQTYESHRVNSNYFRMSGTSMSAPMVSGAVTLLLQKEPNLNPDQVKQRLMSTAATTSRWSGYDAQRAGAGLLDVAAAVTANQTGSANTDVPVSQLLWSGAQPVNWQSVNWNSVNWNSVNWNSVNWNSVNWNSDYWAP